MDQQNQTGAGSSQPGSKKTMYIVIGVVVIIIIAWLAMRGGTRSIAPAGVKVNTSPSGATTYTNKDGTVMVGNNKLPDTWPADAPTYPRGTIQYSGSSNPQTGQAALTIMFLTGDDVASVVDFYKKELVAKGWTLEQTMASGPSTIISAKKDQRTFGVYITAEPGGGQVSVTVGISLQKAN